MVHFVNSASPFSKDLPGFAASLLSEEGREAVLDHRAWLSLNYMKSKKAIPTIAEQYSLLGKLAAELLDEDCTGVYFMYQGRAAPFAPDLAGRLRNISSILGVLS